MIDEQRLREIEERAAKATAGPWEWAGWDLEQMVGVGYKTVIGRDNNSCGYVCCGGHSPLMDNEKPDMEFLKHSRQDVPDLCAEVRRLNAKIKELEGRDA